MAKERMVTRTIDQITAEVATLDLTTMQASVVPMTIGGTYTKEEQLKHFRSMYETDTLKVVDIISSTTEQILLGMPESQFIQLAQVLPSRKKE